MSDDGADERLPGHGSMGGDPSPGPGDEDRAPRRGRTRAEQREDSRRRLLDAAMRCLVEHGYAGTTTQLIAEAAGLSHGTMFNHFASKEDLFAGVVDEYYRAGVEGGAEMVLAIASGELTMTTVVDIVAASFDIPEAQAIQELYVAARRVPRLRDACTKAFELVNIRTLELAGAIFPDLAGNPRFSDAVAMFLAAVRGAALMRNSLATDDFDAAARRGLADALETLALQLRALAPGPVN